MSVEWKVNGETLEARRVTLAGGGFRTQGVSHALFDAALDYDAAEAWEHGDEVTLQHVSGGVSTPFFQGKIHRITQRSNPEYEGHAYALEDAWADLENTIYQEDWSIGTGSYLVPKAVLGIGKNEAGTAWELITVGKQIREALAYAISEGVALTIGSIPDGEILWPSEVANLSVAELIRTCLRFHPDWLPWIDHTTSPNPTFHVTPVNTAGLVEGLTALNVDISGLTEGQDFSVTRRDDMLPSAVRIFYESASIIDSDVYRNGAIDKYPELGPDGGPRVIQATIPLAGLQMQTQKSPIQVRPIPTGPTDEGAKAWLKAKYPHLAIIPDAAFVVTKLERTLLEDPDEHPDPINPEAARLSVADVDDLPNELVRGNINDWMRVRVGKIAVEVVIKKAGDWGGASDEQRRAFDKGTPNISSMTATNAVTKVYRGPSQWTPAESAPTGVAQAIYEAIYAACHYEGSVTISEDEISASRRYGRKINLTGGPTVWASMGAPVHSVDWDVATGKSTVGFGPVPELAPADFMELQRILRRRPVTWWSLAERDSNRLGADGAPSAAGDSVGGFDGPETLFEAPEPVLVPFQVHSIHNDGGTWKCLVKKGYAGSTDPIEAAAPVIPVPEPDSDETDELTISADHKIYCKVTTDKNDLVTASETVSVDGPVTNTHAQPDGGGTDGTYYYPIADFEMAGDELVLKNTYHLGGMILHRPGRNGRALDLEIYGVGTIYWRQGLFVGAADPADTPDPLVTRIVLGSA